MAILFGKEGTCGLNYQEIFTKIKTNQRNNNNNNNNNNFYPCYIDKSIQHKQYLGLSNIYMNW